MLVEKAASRRIVVFTSDLSPSVRKGIIEIDRSIENLSWLVLVHSPSKPARVLLRNQWYNLRRNGWRWIPYQFKDGWMRFRALRIKADTPSAIGIEYTIESMSDRANMKIVRTPDIHAPHTLDLVREFSPDLGLSLAAPILRKTLFSIPKLGTINLHKGKVPNYRGMPPAFWELWNGEQSVGCTVHFVDAKLDTGDIVAQSSITRESFSTLRGLQLRLDELGVAMVRQCAGQILEGVASREAQSGEGKTYRKPTLAQVAELHRSLGLKSRPQFLKNSVASTACVLWRSGLRTFMKPRVVVLLYHRVTDSTRDNLTVGVEQFDAQMALLAEQCSPISIQEVLELRAIPKSGRPIVSVTFDDGYLDNYENAIPILLKHRIPAAFFVSTGIVGTSERFPHDIRRGNPSIPVMQWDQLRDMHRMGFTIGSHSVSHIDCASAPESEVWRELTQSLGDLRRELGLDKVVFAYPYGGREHMTLDRLSLVKRAGYAGCLSAYGGANIGGVDPFNVLRRPIQWEFSNQALMFECLGLR